MIEYIYNDTANSRWFGKVIQLTYNVKENKRRDKEKDENKKKDEMKSEKGDQ